MVFIDHKKSFGHHTARQQKEYDVSTAEHLVLKTIKRRDGQFLSYRLISRELNQQLLNYSRYEILKAIDELIDEGLVVPASDLSTSEICYLSAE